MIFSGLSRKHDFTISQSQVSQVRKALKELGA